MKTAQLINEAADWFARLEDPAATAADREAFDAWLLSSPAHIEAHLKVSRTWGDLGLGMKDAPDVQDLVEQARAEIDRENVVAHPATSPVSSRQRSGFRRPLAYAAAAAILAAVVTSAAWLSADRWLKPASIQTKVGEQRSMTLADGSIVYLNTASEARIELSATERRIVLPRGEARFSVARDGARPFLVQTPQATVRALGTVFNVRAFPGKTAVTVLEGRVVFSTGSSTLELGAGQHAATDRSAIRPGTGPSAEQAMAWSERQLVFRETPLSEVVAEFNRYHPASIRIGDPGLAAQRINGVFDARDSASLIEYLQRYRDVRVQRLSNGEQVISQGVPFPR